MPAELMPIDVLENLLSDLYAATDLSDTMRDLRTDMANVYLARTGQYFAARFY